MAVLDDTMWTYRAALQSDEPLAALRHAVIEGLNEYGGDRDRVLGDLEQLRLVLRRDGQDETPVLDVMDFLTGWCSPKEVI
jgi:hypothetical protein